MDDSYSEPTVLWRLRHPDGTTARATLIPGSPANTVAWFIGDTLDRVENFRDWDRALERADETRLSLLADGWKEIA